MCAGGPGCEYRGACGVQHNAEPDQPGLPPEGAQQQRPPRRPAAPLQMGGRQYVCARYQSAFFIYKMILFGVKH